MSELSILRELTGQLNWLAYHTRPDLHVDVLEMSMMMKSSKVLNLSQANKIVKELNGERAAIKIPRIDNVKNSKIVLYIQIHHMPI